MLALLDFAGLRHQTAMAGGTAKLLDMLILTPGQYLQLHANSLNRDEYPACAALTTGHVFRVENPATVYFLQTVGRTGHLTTLSVNGTTVKSDPQFPSASSSSSSSSSPPRPILARILAPLLSLSAAITTLATAGMLYTISDRWAITILCHLISARATNILLTHRLSRPSRSSQEESSVKGDLLILLSQDRWVRLQGYVDDLKAVTSGTWMRDAERWESRLMLAASLTFQAGIGLWPKATQLAQMMLLTVFLMGAASVWMANLRERGRLSMHGRKVEVVGTPRRYARRRALADELIAETGRDDWAVGLGMIDAAESGSKPVPTDGGVTI